MVDDEPDNEQNDDGGSSIFVVRLGDGDEANFAVCERVGTVEGTRRLPGTGQTVAELVNEQALMAAAISSGDQDGVREQVFMSQSGENRLDHDD